MVIKLTRTGYRKLYSLASAAAARRARRQSLNVLARSRQEAKAIERGAFGGAEDVLRHKGYDLADGAKGMPHFQTPGEYGHTIWGGVLGFLGSLLDPFDAISGELANSEADMDGNGIPDYLEKRDNPCHNVGNLQKVNIMRKFKLVIEGDNFEILLDGKVGKYGFFTTRFVESKDSKEAETLAMKLIRDELESIVLNDSSDPPVMYVEDNYEIDNLGNNLVSGSGFTWFRS